MTQVRGRWKSIPPSTPAVEKNIRYMARYNMVEKVEIFGPQKRDGDATLVACRRWNDKKKCWRWGNWEDWPIFTTETAAAAQANNQAKRTIQRWDEENDY